MTKSEKVPVFKLKYFRPQTIYEDVVLTLFVVLFPLITVKLKSVDSNKNSAC
jgi:hypothetical protein